jgi:hypothetical protein
MGILPSSHDLTLPGSAVPPKHKLSTVPPASCRRLFDGGVVSYSTVLVKRPKHAWSRGSSDTLRTEHR